MRRKLIFAVFSVLVMLAVAVSPAAAVTDGELDGNAHPYVGLMVAYNAAGAALWRCSGTLLAPTIFLTAGHCTEAPAASATVWFDSDVQSLPVCPAGSHIGDPCYPYGGGNSHHASVIHTHPNYDPDAFFLFDLGVVILDSGYNPGSFGALPQLNQLDDLKTRRGLKDVTFTAVGYGLQQSFPDAASWKEHNVKIRMVAHPKLNQINGGIVGDFSLLLSNNANTGGTCFGDSGGPNFIGASNVVAGVTSFGMNGTCGGTGGVYRVDRSDDLNWLAGFMD
jgi:secreted trypsin-like serine protease